MNTLPPHAQNDKTAHIYGLVDPRTSAVFYIGRTTMRLSQRLSAHVDTARRNKSQCKKAQYIRELLKRGLRPGISEIETVPAEMSPQAEGEWIAKYRAIGVDLMNVQSHNVGGISRSKIEWTPDMVARMGKETDEALGQEFGIDRKTVAYQRIKRGIAPTFPYYSNSYRRSRPLPVRIKEQKKEPHTHSRSRKKLRPLPQQNVPKQSIWSEEVIAMMGRYPDTLIAQQFGVSVSCVSLERKKRGIARLPQTNFSPPPPMGGWNKVAVPQEAIEQLGTLPDYKLGEQFGLSKKVIATARKLRGIPSYADQHGNLSRFQKGQLPARWKKLERKGGDANANANDSATKDTSSYIYTGAKGATRDFFAHYK